MNEEREPISTQASNGPRGDVTTAHSALAKVADADGSEARPGLKTDDKAALEVSETDEIGVAAVANADGTAVPGALQTDDDPVNNSVQPGALASPDTSPGPEDLGFQLNSRATGPGETGEAIQAQTATKEAPRGQSRDQDETADFIGDDRTTPPSQDIAPEKPRSRPSRRGRIGPELAGYEILEVIGRGGMGVVYKANQIGLDRVVALKMVLAGAEASPEQLARFSIESQAVAQLQHPGIVQVYEVGEHDGLPYFSLEYVSGGSLAKKIDGKPVPAREAALMVHQLALAMREAHRRNIVHRDLKPANVLLTPEGQPKITDFGLAKRLDADSQQTQTGAVMGTPSYMAPEQAWGETHRIGPRSDLYALGVILYEMLVGRPPFQGASSLETLDLARNQEPVAPTRLQPKVPVDLETICMKCLQKDPDKRYADCSALAEDLQRFLDGRPILARPVGAAERLARWCRRNPKIAALAGTIAALLVAIAAVASYDALRLERANEKLRASNQAESAARKAAQINEHEAIKAADLEALALKREREERQKAQQFAALTLQQNKNALGSLRYISVLTFQRLRDIAGTQELRDELIKTSLNGLRETTEIMDRFGGVAHFMDKEGAAIATRSLAGIYQRAGGMMEAFGHYDEAARYYRQMDEYAEKLAADNPGDLDAKRPLASSKITIGEFELSRLGDSKAALGHLEQNLALRRKFLKRDPKDDQAKRGVCNGLGYLSKVWLKLGDPVKASVYYKEEVDLRGRIGPELAGEVEFRREGAGLEEKLGDRDVALGNDRTARNHYDRALAIREEIAGQNPNHSPAQRDLPLSYDKLGIFHLNQLKDPSGARTWFDKALTAFKSRLKAEPQSVMAKEDLARTEYYMATAELRLGHRKTAAARYKACLAIRETLPGDPKAKLNNIDLMIARARCGQHEVASKSAEELIASPPLDARVYFHAACGFALCAGAAAEASASPEAKALFESYTKRAFKALHLALGAGWKSFVDVQTDPDLDAIRSAPGFEDIVTEFRKANGQ